MTVKLILTSRRAVEGCSGSSYGGWGVGGGGGGDDFYFMLKSCTTVTKKTAEEKV